MVSKVAVQQFVSVNLHQVEHGQCLRVLVYLQSSDVTFLDTDNCQTYSILQIINSSHSCITTSTIYYTQGASMMLTWLDVEEDERHSSRDDLTASCHCIEWRTPGQCHDSNLSKNQ